MSLYMHDINRVSWDDSRGGCDSVSGGRSSCGCRGICGTPACLVYLDLESPSGHMVDEVVHHSSQIVSRACQ
jgi:hypothetical protein